MILPIRLRRDRKGYNQKPPSGQLVGWNRNQKTRAVARGVWVVLLCKHQQK